MGELDTVTEEGEFLAVNDFQRVLLADYATDQGWAEVRELVHEQDAYPAAVLDRVRALQQAAAGREVCHESRLFPCSVGVKVPAGPAEKGKSLVSACFHWLPRGAE
ncbi:MAG: hypothetical protein NDJ89_03360 [Oligoflexia bacterium]|nr:hypothetical protein [Oligoflexia bacterium]